jgi:hypothetical protein
MTDIDNVALHPRIAPAVAIIGSWLQGRLAPQAYQWFRGQLEQIPDDIGERKLAAALGLAPRKLGKADIGLSDAQLSAALVLRPGFDPATWSVDQAARVGFILASFDGDDAHFAALLDRLADTAEINELIALYRGFALYPGARAIAPRAREAIRSSMKPVFEAMAHRNPYPMQVFDSAAWNQMIVKTFFLDSPLWPIQGIEQRANPELARILVDLAHERWAAGRTVSPELWRCVGAHADARGIAAMQRVLEAGAPAERIAVHLSLAGAASDVASGDVAPLCALCERQGLHQQASGMDWTMLSPWTSA